MKGQPCLIESKQPLKDGSTITAMCGREIKESFFTASWDQHVHGTLVFIASWNLCPKCRKVYADILTRPMNQEKRYVYGVLSAAEVKRGADGFE